MEKITLGEGEGEDEKEDEEEWILSYTLKKDSQFKPQHRQAGNVVQGPLPFMPQGFCIMTYCM